MPQPRRQGYSSRRDAAPATPGIRLRLLERGQTEQQEVEREHLTSLSAEDAEVRDDAEHHRPEEHVDRGVRDVRLTSESSEDRQDPAERRDRQADEEHA